MIIEIGGYLVSSEIITEYFCCDYSECKGCCCIVGDSGAPLTEKEGEQLKAQYAEYKPLLSPVNIQAIEKQGFIVTDPDGDRVTPLVNTEGECAYCVTDAEGNTRCAVEMATTASVTAPTLQTGKGKACGNERHKLRKPLSCWLFPIRVSVFSNGTVALNLSREHLCYCAFAKGKKEKIPVYKFLREPLIFRFGEQFYSELQLAAQTLSL